MAEFNVPILIGESKFPYALDDNKNLFVVHNTGEASISQSFDENDNELYVEQREWSQAEKWSHDSGIINVEGELIYYGAVIVENHPSPPDPITTGYDYFSDPNISQQEQRSYQRVIAFKELKRGLFGTPTKSHSVGEWARSYVMSEHHNVLKRSMLGAENLIGIDGSIDHESIDYRLRDLEELLVEKDDLDCPYGIIWYEDLNGGDQSEKEIQFHLLIVGTFTNYEFFPRSGADAITDDLNPIITYRSGENISASLIVYSGRCCSCISIGDFFCEPCEFDPILSDLPTLQIPILVPFEVPSVPDIPPLVCECEACPPCITEDCTPCDLTSEITPIEIVTSPLTIEPLTEISIRNDISISTQTVDVNVSVDVNWLTDQDTSSGGACFMLVPCGGGTGT